MVVVENGSLRDCRLVVTQYPQSGEDALYYELHLEDERGQVIEPSRQAVLYLPYPQGHAYGQQEWAYQLLHYDVDFQRSVTIPLVQTPKGLRCETASFSPFVLGWAKAPAPTQTVQPAPSAPPVMPPKTGDPSEPFLWMMVLALGLLGMSGLALRRHPKRKA